MTPAGAILGPLSQRRVSHKHPHLQASFSVLALRPPLVPGGRTAEAPGGEEGARARGDPEGLRGEQQLHQERQGKAGAEDGGHQGEQGGSAGCHAGEAAGKGQRGLNTDPSSVGNM